MTSPATHDARAALAASILTDAERLAERIRVDLVPLFRRDEGARAAAVHIRELADMYRDTLGNCLRMLEIEERGMAGIRREEQEWRRR